MIIRFITKGTALRCLFVLVWIYSFGCSWGQQRLLIAAHRGGYYDNFPENSISLFRFVQQNFSTDTVMLELDVRAGADGALYILHDETLDRTTNQQGKIIEMTGTELSRVKLKNANGSLSTELLPSFDAVLQWAKTSNVKLMLDVKTSIHEQVLQAMNAYQLESRSLVLTFDWNLTKKVAALSRTCQISMLVQSETDLQEMILLPIQKPRKVAYVTPKTSLELIAKLKTESITVMADVSEGIRHGGKPLRPGSYRERVEKLKLDILITDFPNEARLDFIKK